MLMKGISFEEVSDLAERISKGEGAYEMLEGEVNKWTQA